MAKRINTVKARMDDEEFEKFLRLVKQSGVATSSEYIRQSSLSGQVKPPPPQELVDVLQALLHEYKAQGNNINQIAYGKNASGYLPPAEIRDMQEEHKSLGAEIRAALRKL